MAKIKEIFTRRKEYDDANTDFIDPETGSFYTKHYLDTWKISPFYGKVDTLGIPVMPNGSKMTLCNYGKDKINLTILQPVIRGFFPLRDQYESCFRSGQINKSSKYFKEKLIPQKAYIDGSLEYFDKMKSLYAGFVDYLLANNKFNYIKTFDNFISELLAYIKIKNLYFTRAGYVESYDYSLLHTGLAIEIYKEKTSNEDERLGFFEDVNHDAFLELCIRNNMKIDREVPWRLFLDIRTKPSDIEESGTIKIQDFKTQITEYIPEFTNDIQLFFDKFYDRVIPYDNDSYVFYDEFVVYITGFYNSFVRNYPTYKEYSVKECGKADVKKLTRNSNLLDTKNNPGIYADLYLKFRNVELNKVVSQEMLDYAVEVSRQIFNSRYKGQDTLQESVISSIKNHTNMIGTLAYRNPSLYELDENSKTA